MKHTLYIIGAALACLFALPGCKPTEKNYKSAYDAALRKRESVMPSQTDDGTVIKAIDAPREVAVGGDRIGVKTQFLHSEDPLVSTQPRYVVVVGRYKMPTNARGQVADLKAGGFPQALVMTDGDKMYLAVADFAETLEEVGEKVASLRKKMKGIPFVGLYGDVLVIERPR